MNELQTTAWAAAILRVSLGLMYLSHGLMKLLVFTPAGTAGFFDSLGLPGFLGPVTMLVEITAGILLLSGVFTRLIAGALIPLLFASVLFVHGANGWSFANPGGGWEYPVFLIAASVVQCLLGTGVFSVTRLLPARQAQKLAPL